MLTAMALTASGVPVRTISTAEEQMSKVPRTCHLRQPAGRRMPSSQPVGRTAAPPVPRSTDRSCGPPAVGSFTSRVKRFTVTFTSGSSFACLQLPDSASSSVGRFRPAAPAEACISRVCLKKNGDFRPRTTRRPFSKRLESNANGYACLKTTSPPDAAAAIAARVFSVSLKGSSMRCFGTVCSGEIVRSPSQPPNMSYIKK